jgi:hypothetical protein
MICPYIGCKPLLEVGDLRPKGVTGTVGYRSYRIDDLGPHRSVLRLQIEKWNLGPELIRGLDGSAPL